MGKRGQQSGTAKGARYEQIVQHIFEQLLSLDGLENVHIERNVKIQGIGRDRNIDLAWSFSVAGISYRTIVEAKCWDERVTPEKVDAFKTTLDDIPGQPKGIMITSKGFQTGAQRFADTYGIKLCILRPTAKSDGQTSVVFQQQLPEVETAIDRVTIDSLDGADAVRDFLMRNGRAASLSVVNADASSCHPVLAIIDVLRARFVSEGACGSSYVGEFEGPRWLIARETKDSISLRSIKIDFTVSRGTRQLETDLGGFFSHILEGIIPGRSYRVTLDHRVIDTSDTLSYGMCDFCSWPISSGDKRAQDQFVGRDIVTEGITHDGQIHGNLLGRDWGSCAECGILVRALRPVALLERAVQVSKRLKPRSADQIRSSHDAFWMGYLKRQSLDTHNWLNRRFAELLAEYAEIERMYARRHGEMLNNASSIKLEA